MNGELFESGCHTLKGAAPKCAAQNRTKNTLWPRRRRVFKVWHPEVAFVSVLLLSLVLAAGCHRTASPAPANGAQPKLPTVRIDVGGVPLEVEVADTAETRQKGYMFRQPPADGEGMLFVWPSERLMAFWMQNTPFDIDVGYIGAEGMMFQISRMKSFDRTPINSRLPAKYALEVGAGWFAAHGLREGAAVRIPPEVKSTQDDKPQE